MEYGSPKMYTPKPKMRYTSSIPAITYSNSTTETRSLIIPNKSPYGQTNIRNQNIFKTVSKNHLITNDPEIQKDFDEFSAKSEIFSLLKNDSCQWSSNISNSTTTTSRTGVFNSNEFFEDFLEEDSKIPVRSSNPMFKIDQQEEDVGNIINKFEIVNLKKVDLPY